MTATALEAPRSRGSDESRRGPLFRKLKPGPGHGPEEVHADQRARLQGAMVELVAEGGYPGVTVRGLSRTAGVSTRTFYKHFANVRECFSSTYESRMSCALGRASAAIQAGDDWERNVRESLRATLRGVAEHPKAAHLILVDSFAAGPEISEHRQWATSELEQLLADLLATAPGRGEVPPRVVQGMVNGVTRVAREKLATGRADELPEVADALGAWVLSLHGAYAEPSNGAPSLAAEQSNGQGKRRGLIAMLGGRNGDERERILIATAKLSADGGYRALTTSKIRTAAGVSRRNFDAHFADLDDCFLATVETLTLTAVAQAELRAAGASSWELGVYRATIALCAEISRHPALLQLGFIDIFTPGRTGLRRRERLVALGAERLRGSAPSGKRPSELAAEASMAAAWRIVQAEITAGKGRGLIQIAPLVAHVLLAPVLARPKVG
jgi:AcrR family transcriptional regulator